MWGGGGEGGSGPQLTDKHLPQRTPLQVNSLDDDNFLFLLWVLSFYGFSDISDTKKIEYRVLNEKLHKSTIA